MTVIEPDERELVSLSEIAKLVGFKPSAVSNWRKRYEDFPVPSGRSARGDLFPRDQVLAWLRQRDIPVRADVGLAEDVWTLLDPARDLGLTRLLDLCLEVLAALPSLSRVEEWPQLADQDIRDDITPQLTSHSPGPDAFAADLERPGTMQMIRNLGTSLSGGGHADELADACIALLTTTQGGRQGAEFSTPPVLKDLLVALACRTLTEPASDAINALDPAVGVGGLLAGVAWRYPLGLTRLHGADVNRTTARRAEIRLGTLDAEVDIRVGDTLRDDPFPDLRADLVLIDPPYGVSAPDLDQRLAVDMKGAVRRSGDLAWPLYALQHLSDAGRAGVIQPLGVLFREGPDGDLRREILRRGVVEAVVALPGGLAVSTSIPLCVLLLRSPTSPLRGGDVVLVDASGPRWNWTDQPGPASHDLVNLLNHVDQTGSVPHDFADCAVTVPVLELLAPDRPLTPGYWIAQASTVDVPALLAAAKDSVVQVRAARSAALAASEVDWITWGETSAHLTTLGALVDRGALRRHRGPTIPHSAFTRTGRPVLTTTSVTQGSGPGGFIHDDYPKIHSARLTQPGDVIFAPLGAKAIADTVGGHIAVAPLVVLEIKDADAVLPPDLLAAFMSTEGVAALAQGSALRRVDYRQIQVPILPSDTAEAIRRVLLDLRANQDAAEALVNASAAAREAVLSAAMAGGHP